MPSAWFRPLVHNAASPSLHGVREGPFPRFDTTLGRCDSLPPVSPHFVSFAWRYHRCVRLSSPTPPDAGTRIILEFAVPVSPTGPFEGDGRVSQVPGEPL
jgi:hypothetical protein